MQSPKSAIEINKGSLIKLRQVQNKNENVVKFIKVNKKN